MRKISILFIFLLGCASVHPAAEKENPDLPVVEETPSGKYTRKEWKHWIDADKDCQDTRQEVLIEESRVPVSFSNKNKCTVLAGEWHDPYTGDIITDPTKLDVDHMVPLKEAWRSGGFKWDPDQKKQFANDLSEPEHLIAVSASANRKKGDKDPSEWLPPLESYRCEYVKNWVKIKIRYELSADLKESETVKNILKECR